MELLATVVIVTILCLVLLSGTHKIIESSRSARCVGNLKQLVAGTIAYASDHDMRLPPASSWPTGGIPKWTITLDPYLQTPSGKELTVDYLYCPSVKLEASNLRFATYGINYRYVFFVDALNQNDEQQRKTWHGSMKLTAVPPSAFLFGDSGIPGAGTQGTIYSPYWWTFDSDYDGDGKIDSNKAVGGGPYNWFNPRHNKRGNLAFPDGSVRSITALQWAKNEGGIWGPNLANQQ